MIYVISFGEIKLSFFHIVCHALFKSLLFLRCGILIILSFGNQDRRFMGSFSLAIPAVLMTFLISSLRLLGFPFLTGFFSKDFILELSLFEGGNFLSIFTLLVCCVLTVMYRLRLFFFGLTSYRLSEKFFQVGEPSLMLIVIFSLTFWSVSLGKVLFFHIFNYGLSVGNLYEKIVGLIVISLGLMMSLALNVKLVLKSFDHIDFIGEIAYLN